MDIIIKNPLCIIQQGSSETLPVYTGAYRKLNVSLIEFTHNHYSNGITTYQAEEGMTWEEFVNSEYNTNNIFVLWSGGGVSFNNESNGVQDSSGNFMVKTDIITSQEYYTKTHSTGGGGN